MYNIELTKTAEKELGSLPENIHARIITAIDELEEFDHQTSNVKALKPPFGGYRKRVGDYRILFDTAEQIITIYKISKRSNVYK